MTRSHGLVFASACALMGCDAGSGVQEPQVSDQQPLPAIAVAAVDQRAGTSSSAVAALNDGKGLTASAGDFSLHVNGSDCRKITSELTGCHKDVQIVVSTTNGSVEQRLRPKSIFVAGQALLYRGALGEMDKPDTHTFVLSDLNADARDDLMVWSGREGAYGGPSFDVFIFDPVEQRFVFSRPFSDLTRGNIGLFSIVGGKIKVQSGSGCCIHIRETYAVESNAPKLIERITEDSTQGVDKVRAKTERLVAGELREVTAANE